MSSRKINSAPPTKIDGKAIAKAGLRRSLGLFILFLTVTVPCFMAFFN